MSEGESDALLVIGSLGGAPDHGLLLLLLWSLVGGQQLLGGRHHQPVSQARAHHKHRALTGDVDRVGGGDREEDRGRLERRGNEDRNAGGGEKRRYLTSRRPPDRVRG